MEKTKKPYVAPVLKRLEPTDELKNLFAAYAGKDSPRPVKHMK